MTQLKNHVKVTAEVKGNLATIRVVDYIGEWTDASAFSMRKKVDELLAQGVTTAEVYLNTKGGDVFEAVEMVNELLRIATVEIQVGAVAASAGTYFLSKFKNKAFTNSQIMIHRPKLYTSGDIKKLEADIKLLKNTTEDYKTSYSAKTGKTIEEIEAAWNDGDLWMTAQEAKDFGLVDEVIASTAAPVTAEDVAILKSCGCPTIPSLNNSHTQNSNQMDRLKLVAKLKLPADATDAQIEAALDKKNSDSEAFEAYKNEAKSAATVKAQALVAQAQLDKKITDKEAPHYEKLATADYDSTKAIIDSKVPIPQLSAQLNRQPKDVSDASAPEVKAGWTMQDYLDKDPEGLQALYETAPEVVAELEKGYFGK